MPQPFTNPNYYTQYMPNYSGYIPPQQRLAQMEQQYPQFAQQQQQIYQQQPIGLNGRIVDDISTVNASEVPMDGNMAIFPKRDMSEIYVRNWQNDGTIKTTRYKAQIEEENSNVDILSTNAEKLKYDLSEQLTAIFQERFDELVNRFDKLEKKMTPNKTKKDGEISS